MTLFVAAMEPGIVDYADVEENLTARQTGAIIIDATVGFVDTLECENHDPGEDGFPVADDLLGPILEAGGKEIVL